MPRAVVDVALWWLVAILTVALPASYAVAGWQHARRCKPSR